MQRYQAATVDHAVQMMASLGARTPGELSPRMLRKRVAPAVVQSYAELYEWLEPGQLLAEPPPTWAVDWAASSADTFSPLMPR